VCVCMRVCVYDKSEMQKGCLPACLLNCLSFQHHVAPLLCVCACAWVCACACVYMCVRVCVRARMRVRVCLCMCVYVYMCVYVCLCACVRVAASRHFSTTASIPNTTSPIFFSVTSSQIACRKVRQIWKIFDVLFS